MNIDTCLLYCEHWRRKTISSTVDIVWTCVELVDDIKMQDFNSIITPWDVYITIVVSMLYYSAMMPLSKNIIFRNNRKKTVANCSATNYTKKWRILRHCRTVLTYYYHLLSPVCFKYIWIGVKSWIWFILIRSQFWNTIFEKLKKQLKHVKYPDLPLISLDLLKIPTKKLCG